MFAAITWRGGWRIFKDAPMYDPRINALLIQLSEANAKGVSLDFEEDREACLKRIRANQDADEIRYLQKRLDELNHGFELRWQASQRAIKKWHEAGHPEQVWPDHADLCVWLMEQLETANSRISDCKASMSKAAAFLDDLDARSEITGRESAARATLHSTLSALKHPEHDHEWIDISTRQDVVSGMRKFVCRWCSMTASKLLVEMDGRTEQKNDAEHRRPQDR